MITVRTRDDDRDNITYGLEKSPYLIEGFNYDGSPYFSIHQRSGDVFLQKSFVGQVINAHTFTQNIHNDTSFGHLDKVQDN